MVLYYHCGLSFLVMKILINIKVRFFCVLPILRKKELFTRLAIGIKRPFDAIDVNDRYFISLPFR